ncbi:hypothetical protein NPIL_623521 [Nephila pilipes]|uniref:Uncharacterized protein n=1 Tax=Nephila pilipes TaxID=299642 RepID=A0A8X6NTB0_NEPPI|nr:hypothetical protein NPIL_623521 [Nephila pilipes]
MNPKTRNDLSIRQCRAQSLSLFYFMVIISSNTGLNRERGPPRDLLHERRSRAPGSLGRLRALGLQNSRGHLFREKGEDSGLAGNETGGKRMVTVTLKLVKTKIKHGL